MDSEEIQAILNQVYSQYPWAGEDTFERMAELTRSSTIKTTALATAIARVNGAADADQLKSHINDVKKELDESARKIQSRIDSIDKNTRSIGRATMNSGATGLESMVELAGAGAEAMHAAADGLTNMGNSTARKIGWASKYFTGGMVAVTGVGAVVAKTIASQEKELRNMIDMGMALGNTANYTQLRGSAVDAALTLGDYAALLQNSSSLVTNIGGSMIAGQGLIHSFLTDQDKIKTVKNFGYSPKVLSALLTEETEQLYELNEINSLNEFEQNKVIESFQTANQMGMYLADTLGVQRSAMLEARKIVRENVDFQLAMNQNTAFLEEKYGTGAAERVREAGDWLAMLTSATMGDEMSRALMDVFVGTSADIQFDESAINNIQDEQLRKTLQLLDPGVFEGFMRFIEDGAKGELTGPANTTSRFQELLTLIRNSPTLAGLDPESIAVNELIAAVQILPESFFQGSAAEIKAKMETTQEVVDGADDSIEIVGGMSKAFLKAQHTFIPGFETMGSVMGVLENSIGTFTDFWMDMFGLGERAEEAVNELLQEDGSSVTNRIVYSNNTANIGGSVVNMDTTTIPGYNEESQTESNREFRIQAIQTHETLRNDHKSDQDALIDLQFALQKLRQGLNLDDRLFKDNLIDIVNDTRVALEKAQTRGEDDGVLELALAEAEKNLADAQAQTQPLEDQVARLEERMQNRADQMLEISRIIGNQATPTVRSSVSAYGPGSSLQGIVLAQLAKEGITDPVAQANILGMIQGESGFRLIEEQSYENTSNDRIRAKMGNRVSDLDEEQLTRLKANPEEFFNYVYSNIGGYKYRGRGFIQLTGEENYKLVGDMIGHDLHANPELMLNADIAAAASAAYFNLPWWQRYKGDLNNMDTVYRVVYGATATSSGRTGDLNQRSEYAAKFAEAMNSGELTAATEYVEPTETVSDSMSLDDLRAMRLEIMNDGPLIPGDVDEEEDWLSQIAMLDEAIAIELKRLEDEMRESEVEGNP